MNIIKKSPFFSGKSVLSFTVATLLFALLGSCSKQQNLLEEYPEAITKANITLNSFGSAGAELTTVHAFLYLDGKVLKAYSDLSGNNYNLSLPLEYYTQKGAELFFVANTGSVQSGIPELLQSAGGAMQYSADKLIFTHGKIIAPKSIPLGSRIRLSDVSSESALNVELTRTHSRVDFLIEEQQVEIDSVKFTNLSTGGVFTDIPGFVSDYYGELFDHVERFSPPVTASRTIGYLNEQRNSRISVQVYGKFNGLRVAFSTAMPSSILRNNIYTVRVVKVGTTLTASVTINDWKEGDIIDATPDPAAKVLIDVANSVFPIQVKSSATQDTLFIPSNKNSSVSLALQAQYEVVPSILGNPSDITITPAEGFNRFTLNFKGDPVGEPQAYYSHIVLRNKFFKDEYGQRLVIRAQNFDIPEYLNAGYRENGSSLLADGSLGLSGAGFVNADAITVSALLAGSAYTIRTVELVSLGSETYPSLRYAASLNGGKVRLNTPVNYSSADYRTGKGLKITLQKGSETTITTLPLVIKAGPTTIPSDFFVEMYGVNWVQVTRQTDLATTVANFKTINACAGTDFDMKLNAHRTALGTSIDGQNNAIGGEQVNRATANATPIGFRLPTMAEYYALFGATYTGGAPLNLPPFGLTHGGSYTNDVNVETTYAPNVFATYKSYSAPLAANGLDNAYYLLFRNGVTGNKLSLTFISNYEGGSKYTSMWLAGDKFCSGAISSAPPADELIVPLYVYTGGNLAIARWVKDTAANAIW